MQTTTDREAKAEHLRWAFQDFRRFCGLIDILPKEGPRQKLVLNDIQKIYCRNRTSRDVILKARQVGMTTLEQARDIWHFLTHPGARVTAMCQSIADVDSPARVLARNYSAMLEGLQAQGLRLKFGKASGGVWELPERDAVLRIVEAGASKAAAQKKGRAGTITRLHATEVAFWEYATDTLNAIVECVPNPEYGTEIVFESTPNGASGKFYEDCQKAAAGVNGYAFHFYPWHLDRRYRTELAPGEVLEPETDRERQLVVAGVSQEQLKWYRAKVLDKGQDLADQEYPSDPQTCFLVSGRLFFDRSKTEALLSRARDPIETYMHGALRVWMPPHPQLQYVIGVDTSEGIGGDPAAAIIYERTTGQHCATLHGQFRPWDLARAVAEIGRRYNAAVVAVERNNHGHAVLRALEQEQRYPKIFKDRDGAVGWVNSEVTRSAALDALEDAHRRGQFATLDKALIGEQLTFVINAKGKAEAASGSHDDLVMAAAIGWDVIRKPLNIAIETGPGWGR